MSKKKNLLFIINNLNCGGAEKALVSLLQTLDYSQYDVDLYLFKREGLFLKQVPREVTILPSPENYPYFDMSLKKAIIENLKKGKFGVVWNRLIVGWIYRTEKTKAVQEQKAWRYIKKVISPLHNKYHAAISFLEKNPNYFCVDKVTAKIKIGFIMNDYEKLMMDKTIDTYYFDKFDFIVTDSEESKKVLMRNFLQFEPKFRVVKSILSPLIINKMADETVGDFPQGFKLVSVGRLTYQKGYDLAIQACKILADNGYKFKWYILGEGEDKASLKQMIEKLQLADYFVFLGIKENHYPYLKQADIFVHTARFEGFGIVVSEAKILHKPIVLTDFNVARSHLKDSENGFIAEMNPEAIALKIERLINDEELRKQFSSNLSAEKMGTEDEISRFYDMIN